MDRCREERKGFCKTQGEMRARRVKMPKEEECRDVCGQHDSDRQGSGETYGITGAKTYKQMFSDQDT